MEEIYQGNSLKYPLTESEYEKIDDVWDFIQNFKKFPLSLHKYRSSLIETIKNKYSNNEFYILEFITEKLFWNLRECTYKMFLTENQKDINDLLELKEGSYTDSLNNMYNDNSYRSFINKLILIDDIDNKYFYKKIEGSAEIFNQNKFNIYTSTTLFNRNLYELIMMNPKKIKKIFIPKYYYEYDYPFPNLNFGRAFCQTHNFRKERINRMYYDHNAEENWFKLIKPLN